MQGVANIQHEIAFSTLLRACLFDRLIWDFNRYPA